MFLSLKPFLENPALTRQEAAWTLRKVFALSYLGQVAVICLFGLIMFGLAGQQNQAQPIVAQVLILLSFAQLPLAVAVASLLARAGGKGGALSAAISLGVILSTPAWYALFIWLTGASATYLMMFMGLIMGFYGLGFILAGQYARIALTPPRQDTA